MIYRALTDLTYKGQLLKQGALVDMELSNTAEHKLLRADAIAQVSGPPLSIVAGWQARAKRLETLGIVKVEELLMADTEQVATALRVRPQTVKEWKKQVEKLLIA